MLTYILQHDRTTPGKLMGGEINIRQDGAMEAYKALVPMDAQELASKGAAAGVQALVMITRSGFESLSLKDLL